MKRRNQNETQDPLKIVVVLIAITFMYFGYIEYKLDKVFEIDKGVKHETHR